MHEQGARFEVEDVSTELHEKICELTNAEQ